MNDTSAKETTEFTSLQNGQQMKQCLRGSGFYVLHICKFQKFTGNHFLMIALLCLQCYRAEPLRVGSGSRMFKASKLHCIVYK